MPVCMCVCMYPYVCPYLITFFLTYQKIYTDVIWRRSTFVLFNFNHQLCELESWAFFWGRSETRATDVWPDILYGNTISKLMKIYWSHTFAERKEQKSRRTRTICRFLSHSNGGCGYKILYEGKHIFTICKRCFICVLKYQRWRRCETVSLLPSIREIYRPY
jgi:hypothetical protein